MAEHAGLWLGEELRFPPDVVTETLLIIAKRGSGKTHTASVLVEELISAGLRTCVIDPIGVWWGLRSNAAGDGPGLPVTILGGEHADLPLSPESGTVVADLVVGEQIPFVLDLSLMSKTQQRRFVTDFLERLYHRNRDPLHLVVDEADLFAPLRGGKDTMRLLGSYEDIVRRGRARGLGCTSITQRPAVLHTDIRSQAEVLIALRLIGTHDVAAIDDWIRLHATDEEAREVKASLPSLPVGTAWVWSPGWLEILAKVKIRQRLTFDSSATPKVGQQRIVPREFARVDGSDLDRLAAKLAPPKPEAKPVQQRGRMPDEEWRRAEVGKLKAQVTELQRQLAEAAEPERVEVPVLSPGDIAALEQSVAALQSVAGSIELALSRATRPAPAPARQAPSPRPVVPVQAVASGSRNNPGIIEAGSATSLPKAQRAILTVLAQFPEGCTKRKLAMLTGYAAKGGGFNNSLSSLRSSGFIERGEPIRATTEGVAALGTWEPLPEGAALVAHWMGQLGKAEAEALRVLLDAWPATLNKTEIASRTDRGDGNPYAADGGGFNNALSRLRTLQLIDGYGEIAADETLAVAAQEAPVA